MSNTLAHSMSSPIRHVAGQYTSETSEPKFRKVYLRMLAEEIGRSFHPYDFTDRIASDGRIASQWE